MKEWRNSESDRKSETDFKRETASEEETLEHRKAKRTLLLWLGRYRWFPQFDATPLSPGDSSLTHRTPMHWSLGDPRAPVKPGLAIFLGMGLGKGSLGTRLRAMERVTSDHSLMALDN